MTKSANKDSVSSKIVAKQTFNNPRKFAQERSPLLVLFFANLLQHTHTHTHTEARERAILIMY
jgi:hypothetical protein